MKKFFFIISLLFFLIKIDFAYGQINLPEKINNLFLDSLFQNSIASVEIYDLTADKYLYRKNEKLLLRPASTMKILTSAAALFFLGKEFNFETSLAYDGNLEEGILNGNLYVIGGCDPDFITEDIDTLISKINLAGIKKINGNIYADVSKIDSLFWGKGWMWDDDPSSDAPYLSALNINDNTISVEVIPQNLNEKPYVNLYPQTYYTAILNNAKTINLDTGKIKISRNWIYRTNEILVEGMIYKNSNPVIKTINLFDPAYYFLTLLKEKLQLENIVENPEIKIKKFETGFQLYSHKRNLVDVIFETNKESDNLNAEMLLRALAFNNFDAPATAENGIKMIDSLFVLANIKTKNYRIADGSGVSHYNLMTAEMLTEILKFIYKSRPDLYEILYNSFPVAGVDGTLRSRMKNNAAFNNVRAKTGTLSGVSCLSGYANSKKGNLIAFSIMVQNFTESSREARKFQDEVCRIITEM